MTLFALLFTLACVGISETAYLIEKRQRGEKPICVLGKDCVKVLESKYNQAFIFHNDVWGLVFYFTMATLTALLVVGVEPLLWWERFMKVLVVSGAVISVILTYVQWRVLRAWCFWCVLSALTVFGMGIILFIFEII